MDYLAELFGHMTAEDHAACSADNAHRASLLADPVRPASSTPCPKCSGTGNIPQFQHRKGGECFTCGGSGIFARFA